MQNAPVVPQKKGTGIIHVHTTTLYDKRDVFQFYIVSNIPIGPAYGTYISQLV